MTPSGGTRPSPLTGAVEIQLTTGTAQAHVAPPATARCRTWCRVRDALRASLDLDLVALELEDVEVPPGHVDRDVIDRHAPNRTLEAAAMGMAVQDDVGPILGDRAREPVAAEKRPDPLGLPVQGVGRRRVMEQDDPDRAVRNLLEPAPDRRDLLRRLRIDAAEKRLTEVRQL